MRNSLSAAIVLVCLCAQLSAQDGSPVRARLALSTNLTDYVYLLTPNIDIQYAVSRQVTADAGIRYNAWSFNHATEKEVKNRQQTYYAGARWWPWYTYSGWWLGSSLQFQEYDRGGLLRKDSESGNALGLSISGGYSVQISQWFNIDVGVGIWGGKTKYTVYECPYCGKVVEEGEKAFVLPNEARLALQFIF